MSRVDDIRARIATLKAERASVWAKAEGLKISCNGALFGKTAEAHSFLYAPEISIATTLTGQLSLLMLIERLEAAGARVVSGNTDGVMAHLRRDLYEDFERVLADWCDSTGFVVERVRYSAVYSRDVNTYVALKEGGGDKRKGWVDDPWGKGNARDVLRKNREMHVLGNAVLALVADGAPLADTVRACWDVRQLITVRHVRDGGLWRGHRLGRAVRFYWSTDGDPIVYPNGNRVPKTEGARPLVELPAVVPPDVDWDRYVREAERLARDLGALAESGSLIVPLAL